MRRFLPIAVGFACLSALLVGFFGPALFRGEQFSFRDAGHFYYPLYLRVQQEWQAGRLPLWSPEENSGMPLLGNPTAAVLYPGKLIYAATSYPWGARLYIIGHVLLALAAMYILMRSWDVSPTGSALSALGYAFGAPVLFQYCNIIFLVGAAWAPLGIRAADRWLRLKKRWAIAELAVVLAMQTLGGEPQSAYIVGLCAGGYAVGLSGRIWTSALKRIAVLAVLAWIPLTLLAAAYFPRFRKIVMPPEPLPWSPWVSYVVALAWLCAAYAVWRRRKASPLWSMLLGLAGSAVLAGALAGMQLLPVLEFTSMTIRASIEGTHDPIPFSLEPVRLVELAWPGFFGNPYLDNRNWLINIMPHSRAKYWVPSLYMGGLTFVLAVSALFQKGPRWLGWMKGIAAVSAIAAFGEYASPIYYAREIPAIRSVIGVHDSAGSPAIRYDGKLRDGDGCPYSLLSESLPGFRSFRYPSKLLTFTSLALAALAGFGWDRATRDGSKSAVRIAIFVLLTSAAAMAALVVEKGAFLAWLNRTVASRQINSFGPFSADGAWIEARDSVLQASIVMAMAVVLLIAARKRPLLAGALALGVSTTDLIAANARFVISSPQSDFEKTPRVLSLIAEAEKKNPAPGPYRVHRMPLWAPPGWHEKHSANRITEVTNWERDTIQPKYALPLGLRYTVTEGTAELFDYMFFFSGFHAPAPPELASEFRVRPGDQLVYFPRRGFDLWGSRYFVIPGYPANDERRGYAMFLPDTERIYPPPDAFVGPGSREAKRRWVMDEDFQILRNNHAYPRAWVVHGLRFFEPIRGLRRADRTKITEEMLFANDIMWKSKDRLLFDPHQIAWVETDNRPALAPFAPGYSADASETPRVVDDLPDRVSLDVEMKYPGVVVVADVFYPGWELTVDDQPAEILRVNRLMRGAALKSGHHRLVFRYRPQSVQFGAGLSIAGFCGLIGVGIWSIAGRRRVLLNSSTPIGGAS